MSLISRDELTDLHGRIEEALASRDDRRLHVIGWGEISLGVGWPGDAPRVVAKRLPPFPDADRFGRYAEVVEDYVAALGARGVDVVETEVHGVDTPGGRVPYCVQPVLPAASIGPAALADVTPDPAHPLVRAIVGAVADVVDERLGFDAQLANWSWHEGRIRYLDVTTPLLRDAGGRDRLDLDVMLAAYPWLLRGALRRWVAPDIVARYHERRSVLRDLCANLVKERREDWLDAFLEAANRVLDRPLTAAEVRADYRADARMWEWIQRIRRADRGWHRLRGRTYPFLLPGEIQR